MPAAAASVRARILRIHARKEDSEPGRLARSEAVDGGHPPGHRRLLSFFRSPAPLPCRHGQEEDAEEYIKPVDPGGGVTVRVARSSRHDQDDDAHGHQAGHPTERECRPGRSGLRGPEHQDDRDDGHGAECDTDGGRQKVADGLAQHDGIRFLRGGVGRQGQGWLPGAEGKRGAFMAESIAANRRQPCSTSTSRRRWR